jgi:predicted Zn-dependent peptidase
MIFCDVGSINEKNGLRGISHFVEHMCFKGTENVHKVHNLYKEYNKIGAHFNAHTTKRYTSYVVKCQTEHATNCITILSDILLHSIISKKEYTKEKHVIMEESIRLKDDNKHFLFEKLDAIYFNGSAYAYPIDSTSYHKKMVSHEDLREWYDTFYCPSRMTMSIVTDLPFASIRQAVEKTDLVIDFPLHRIPQPSLQILPLRSTAHKVHVDYIHKKGIHANIISIGFRTCPHNSADTHALNLIKSICNGFSGKLFTRLRSDRGLTYRSTAITQYYEHSGYFMIYAQTDPAKMIHGHNVTDDGVIQIIIGLLSQMKGEGVSTADIALAKGKMKGTLALALEDIDTVAKYNGSEYILTDASTPIPHHKLYDTYYAPLQKRDINAVIQKYFTRDNMVVAIVHDKAVPYDAIHRICNRFR